MPNLFMRISNELHREIQTLMKIEGYLSRAEFIRFLIKFYKYHHAQRTSTGLQENIYKWGEKANILRQEGYSDALGEIEEHRG